MTTPEAAIKRAGAAIALDAAHRAKPMTTDDERKGKAALEAAGFTELYNALAAMIELHIPVCRHPIGAPHSPAREEQDRKLAAIGFATAVMNFNRGIGPRPRPQDFFKDGEQS